MACTGVYGRYLSRDNAHWRDQRRSYQIPGAGRQASIQLMGTCAVRQMNGAVVVEPNTQARQRFADQMSKALGIPLYVQPGSPTWRGHDGQPVMGNANYLESR